jgi:hypothetical protein
LSFSAAIAFCQVDVCDSHSVRSIH